MNEFRKYGYTVFNEKNHFKHEVHKDHEGKKSLERSFVYFVPFVFRLGPVHHGRAESICSAKVSRSTLGG